MTRQEPNNPEAERRLLGSTLTLPDLAVPKSRAMGLGPEDFFLIKNGYVWEAVVDLHSEGMLVNKITVEHWLRARQRWNSKVDELIQNLPSLPGEEAEHWAAIVLDQSSRRAQLAAARDLGNAAFDEESDLLEKITKTQADLDSITSRIIRMRNPAIENPAIALRRSRSWSTQTGVPFLDCMLRFVSGEIDSIAGDPGVGKSTCAYKAATFNAFRLARTSVLILAESDVLDAQMAMLLFLGRENVDSMFVSRVRYDPQFRTETHIKIIEEMWEENYAGIPLRIYEATGGVDEVVSIAASITEPSFIQVDHAYGVVSQTGMVRGIQEHQHYINLFSRLRRAGQRNNNCTVVYNQFKLSGRVGEEDRGPDAQYGGSGIRNIASSITHLWPVSSQMAHTADGVYRRMTAKCWKARARLVADTTGVPVNPEGMEVPYWFAPKYRQIISDNDFRKMQG